MAGSPFSELRWHFPERRRTARHGSRNSRAGGDRVSVADRLVVEVTARLDAPGTALQGRSVYGQGMMRT